MTFCHRLRLVCISRSNFGAIALIHYLYHYVIVIIMRKVIILGPPCVGKTTLAYLALNHKIPSFSTHQPYFINLRQSGTIEEFVTYIIKLDISLFLDAGGVNINYINQYKNKGFGIRTVLLLPTEEVYLQRRKDEIAKNPGRELFILKWKHTYYEFKDQISEFDLVIEDVLSPQEIFNYIK